jgi:hypothetical protein
MPPPSAAAHFWHHCRLRRPRPTPGEAEAPPQARRLPRWPRSLTNRLLQDGYSADQTAGVLVGRGVLGLEIECRWFLRRNAGVKTQLRDESRVISGDYEKFTRNFKCRLILHCNLDTFIQRHLSYCCDLSF